MTDSAQLRYAVWPTAWGPMGAVAGEQGLVRLVLPHYSLGDLKALLAFEHAGSVEDAAPFAPLVELSRQYFNGKPVSFDAIPCQLPAENSFGGKVLRHCRAIPYGQTRSYTQLATLIGNPDAARAVAAALGKNCVPLVIPCHRVLYAGGKLGGFSAPGGIELKQRMLRLEQPSAGAK